MFALVEITNFKIENYMNIDSDGAAYIGKTLKPTFHPIVFCYYL